MARSRGRTKTWAFGALASFDKALPFYRDLLGLKVQLDGRIFNWIEVGPEEPHAKIGLYEAKPGGEGSKPGKPTGIAFETDDINEFHKRLSSKGSGSSPHLQNRNGEEYWQTSRLRREPPRSRSGLRALHTQDSDGRGY